MHTDTVLGLDIFNHFVLLGTQPKITFDSEQSASKLHLDTTCKSQIP